MRTPRSPSCVTRCASCASRPASRSSPCSRSPSASASTSPSSASSPACSLRPLPYQQPARLVFLWEGTPSFPDMSVSFLDFSDWRKMQHTFVDIAAARQQSYTLTGIGHAERVQSRMVSANFLRVLGVKPALGRDFLDAEEQLNAPPVALVSDKFWRERLGADAGALGRTLTLDGRAFTIVGVLPPSFRFNGDSPVYVTLAHLDTMTRDGRGSHPGMYGIGRLKDGVTPRAGDRRHGHAVGRAIQIAAGNAKSEVLPRLAPLQSKQVEDVQVTLLAAPRRRRLRAAHRLRQRRQPHARARHGTQPRAGRARRARGRPLGADAPAARRERASSPSSAARSASSSRCGASICSSRSSPTRSRATPIIKVDRSVLVYSLGDRVADGAPVRPGPRAARLARRRERRAQGGRLARRRRRGATAALRAALVVAEVALALVLLVGAGLSMRTFEHLSSLDVGFKSEEPSSPRRSRTRRRATTRRQGAQRARRDAAPPGAPRPAWSTPPSPAACRSTARPSRASRCAATRRTSTSRSTTWSARLPRHHRHQAPRRARSRRRRRSQVEPRRPRRRDAGARSSSAARRRRSASTSRST